VTYNPGSVVQLRLADSTASSPMFHFTRKTNRLLLTYRCFVFSLQPAGTLSINDVFLSEKFSWSVLSADPLWSDLKSSYDAQGLEDSGTQECLRRSKILIKEQVSETHARWRASRPIRPKSGILPYTSTAALLRAGLPCTLRANRKSSSSYAPCPRQTRQSLKVRSDAYAMRSSHCQ
jgi:hypothetical protein